MASLRALDRAEMDLLVAAQRAARQDAVKAIASALDQRHAGAVAAISSRYAAKRAALVDLTGDARAAALDRLLADEAREIARLVTVYAAEKRAMKRATALAMLPPQRQARRALRQSLRRRRIVVAVRLAPRETGARRHETRLASRRRARLETSRR